MLSTNAKVLLFTSYEQSDIVINASRKALASGYVFKSYSNTLCDIVCETAYSVTPQSEFIKELILSQLSPAERSLFESR